MRIFIGCAPLKSGLAEHKGKNSVEMLRSGIFWIFSRSITLQYGEKCSAGEWLPGKCGA